MENTGEFESDPAAEFLAQEQNDLAGLNDDEYAIPDSEGNEPSDQPDISTNGPVENGEAEPESDGWEAISKVDRQLQEPEKIKLWRKEQQERLSSKDSEEDKKKQELREAAKKELDQWYEKQAEQLKKTKVNNREAESVFLEERDNEKPGQEWERIARLCDFNPKTSKHSKDISRMRSIILQLKGQPMQQKT